MGNCNPMTAELSNADKANMELQRASSTPPTFIGDAFAGGVFESYTEFVASHAIVPGIDEDRDNDGKVDRTTASTPIVPLYVYGDGPHDYIATDFDAGQVMVRDGNDKSGKAWKFDEEAFRRYVARAQGKPLPDDDEEDKGDNPIVAARKLAERTAQKVEADNKANERAASLPAGSNVEKVDRPGGKPAGTKS